MKSILYSVFIIATLAVLMAFRPQHKVIAPIAPNAVVQVLKQLGVEMPKHTVNTNIIGVSAEAGKELMIKGFTSKDPVGKTQRQSRHFVCTSCHNVVVEDPDLRYADPDARLQYVADHDLPFLPATTFYGIINRKTFYNGDYEKKYGDLVKPARHSLRGAIALCAVECAQGRELEEWEMESIVAYLWTIGLQLSDLNIPQAEMDIVMDALAGNADATTAANIVQSYFLDHSPATFITPPPNRNDGYGLKGNAENGKKVYEQSCLHCHAEQRYSFFDLDKSDYSKDYLGKHFEKYTRHSAYQVIRYGTSPMNGKRAYMPHFTLERMSNQQVEDLKAYLNN